MALFGSQVGALAADVVPSPPGANRPNLHLRCETIEAPKRDPSTPPTQSCDDICKPHDEVCVWNADGLGAHSCETPVYFASCRCCSVSQ
jgi:hypothetical protein